MNSYTIKELLEEEKIDWDIIEKTFLDNSACYETLLFKIHFKRKKVLSAVHRNRILIFLSKGYVITNDIRYFNEFLWFYNDSGNNENLLNKCKEKFYLNLDKGGFHKTPSHLAHYSIETNNKDLRKVNIKNEKSLRICLIGFPPFFGKIIKELSRDGHHIQQFFLPYHPNRYINILLKINFIVKIFSLLSGNFYNYRVLKFKPKDKEIRDILKSENFDIGFHKLNFIIKENIYSVFKFGLLNDHWGYLPLLRGKSTIAYSLLLNVPVISTIHFIDEGIDTGPIVGYYPIDYEKAKSVKDVRNILRKKLADRVVSAIKHIGTSDFITKENQFQSGVTFYEIHSWLSKHISENILK